MAALRDANESISDSLLKAMTVEALPRSFEPFSKVITQKDDDLIFKEFKALLRGYEETSGKEGKGHSIHEFQEAKIKHRRIQWEMSQM